MRASTRRGVNIEVAPDPRDEEAKSAFEALPEDGKKGVTYKVAERILPQLLRNMGVEGRIEYTIGGFAGGTAPSIIVHFDEATPYSAVKEFAVASGALLRQQAAISYDESSTGGNQTTFVAVRPNRELSYEEQQALFKEIYDRYPAAEGFTGRDGVMVFGNFGETPDAAFHAGIDKALSEISHSAEFSTDLRRFESDWHEPLNLEDTRYGQSDQSQNRGAVARGQGFFDALQAEADRLTRDAIAAAGRGAGYSGARARGSRAGDEGGADRLRAPSYGTRQSGGTSLTAFHYSKAQRSSLAGRVPGAASRHPPSKLIRPPGTLARRPRPSNRRTHLLQPGGQVGHRGACRRQGCNQILVPCFRHLDDVAPATGLLPGPCRGVDTHQVAA